MEKLFGERIFTEKKVALFIFLSLITPFTLFRRITKLKYTSLCGLIAIAFVVAGSIYRLAMAEITIEENTFYAKTISLKWLRGLGTFIFSFTCHQNLISVQNEMSDNRIGNMKKLIVSVVTISFVLYSVFGLINYLMYGHYLADNVLKNYPDDKLTDISLVLYILVMGFSYPLQINPCRIYLYNLFGLKSKKIVENDFLHGFVTLFIILAGYLLTINGLNLGDLYSLIGATASTLISLIMPPLFYFYMDFPKNNGWTILSITLLIAGIGIVLATLLDYILRY